MPYRTALRNPIVLAGLLTAVAALAWPVDQSLAQEGRKPPSSRQAPYRQVGPGPTVGGTSLTLRDIWGPAEMPPTPKDFGPHFDFQPEALSGGLNHDPYPN